jgi:hypothetical protein
VNIVETNAALGELVRGRSSVGPEVRQSSLFGEAAEADRRGRCVGPGSDDRGAGIRRRPGGGPDGHLGSLGDTEDYFVGLGWRIGPADCSIAVASVWRSPSSLKLSWRLRRSAWRFNARWSRLTRAAGRCRTSSNCGGGGRRR